MTREPLQFETSRNSSRFTLQSPIGIHLDLPDHTPFQPGNQPGSSMPQTKISSEKNRNIFGSRDKFQAILTKLQGIEIPGKEHVELYLRDQYRRNLRLSSIKNASTAIVAFLILLLQGGKTCLERITRSDLGAYIEREQDKGLKASTVKHRLDVLKAFIRYLIEKEIVSADILVKRMIIKIPQSLPKAIETEHEEKLLSVIDDVRNRAMILLLLRTGMRIGELLNTQIQDIDLKEQKILVWEAQKNRIGRAVYFTDDARDALIAWYGKRDVSRQYIFYGPNRQTLTYAAARIVFCKYLAKADLSHRGYTLHCLRHTNASSLLNAGMPLECVKELLGHTSVEVTRRYARLTNKTREKEYFKAMDKITKGEIDGHYKLDLELQKIIEEAKLLTPNGKKLHE